MLQRHREIGRKGCVADGIRSVGRRMKLRHREFRGKGCVADGMRGFFIKMEQISR